MCKCTINKINGEVTCGDEAKIPFEKELGILCNNASLDEKRKRTTCISQRNQINQSDWSTNQLLFYTMTSQEFAHIPKENYVWQQAKTSEVLVHATINE